MKAGELRELLEDIIEEHGEDVGVRIAYQPSRMRQLHPLCDYIVAQGTWEQPKKEVRP